MKTFSKVPDKNEKSLVIDCPLCGNKNYIEHWDLKTFKYVKCKECSLVYQNPQPKAEDVQIRYDDSYFKYEIENEESFLNLILLALNDAGIDYNKSEGEDKKILDIGCATGLFLEFMKKRGWLTYGVEVCTPAAEYGNKHRGVNIFPGTLEDSNLEKESMDIIHISHVIEHINDPDKFVKKIYSLLKPGGYLYCTTPNVSGFQAKLFKSEWRSAIADHLVLFSISTLIQLLRNNGFIIENYKTWGGLCANSGYPGFIKKIMDKAAKPLGFGDVVIVKVKKPKLINT